MKIENFGKWITKETWSDMMGFSKLCMDRGYLAHVFQMDPRYL